MGVSDASLNMKIFYLQHRNLLPESGGTKVETDQVGQVQSHLQGNIKLNPV